jgi:two-component system response regulator AgrA
MKIYYIEDDIFLHKEFINYSGEIFNSGVSAIEIPKINQLELFYDNIMELNISKEDVFIIDISLNIYYSGIDFAKRIRENQQDCSILFLTSDTSKGIEIINSQIRPDKYLLKNDMHLAIKEIANYIVEKNKLQLEKQSVVYSSAHNTYLFDPNEINYFTKVPGSRNTIEVYKKAEIISFSGNLTEIKTKFKDCNYFSELKSYLINPSNISFINRTSGEIIFKNNDKIFLSSRNITKLNRFIKSI